MKSNAVNLTYGLKHNKSGIVYSPLTGFDLMTHKEACTFKSKMTNPDDWQLITLSQQNCIK